MGGHGGILKTYDILKRGHWWTGMKEDALKYVSSCETCARTRVSLSSQSSWVPKDTAFTRAAFRDPVNGRNGG